MRRSLVVLLLLAVACAETPTSLTGSVETESSTGGSVTGTVEGASKVKVPSLVGLKLSKAKDKLGDLGLEWKVARRVSSKQDPGEVISQSIKAGRKVTPGKVIVLTVAKEAPPPPPPESNCHSSYEGACLLPGASDYDCAGGSGNGPYYVAGPVYVVGYDVFGLDGDGDGVGCE